MDNETKKIIKGLEKKMDQLQCNITKTIQEKMKPVLQDCIKELLKESMGSLEIKMAENIDHIKKPMEKNSAILEKVEESQEFMSSQYDTLLQTSNRLEQKITTIQQEMNAIKYEKDQLQLDLHRAQNEIDLLDNQCRRDTLETKGIPQLPNENTTDLIIHIASLLSVKVTESDISTTYRMPVKTPQNVDQYDAHPTLIVKFSNIKIRNQLLRQKKAARFITDFGIKGMDKLYINESLSYRKRQLFHLSRTKKTQMNYAACYTQNARIFIRKTKDGEKFEIKSKMDLEKLV